MRQQYNNTSLGKSSIYFDNATATGFVAINGTSLVSTDATNIPPTQSIT
jgi:hypothetical protein